MYVSMSRLRVAADRSDALVAAFRDRARLVDGADGFVDLQVWRSDRDPEEVLMVSRWRDRAAFTAYMRSDEHHVSHDRIDPELKAAIRLEQLARNLELAGDVCAEQLSEEVAERLRAVATLVRSRGG